MASMVSAYTPGPREWSVELTFASQGAICHQLPARNPTRSLAAPRHARCRCSRDMRIALLFVAAAGCGGQLAASSDDAAGGGADAAPSGTCITSSECPTGFICNEFGRCEMPAPPPGDGGTTP